MAEHSRYSVSKDEEQGVLKNKFGITDQKKLDDTETLLLYDTYSHFFDLLAARRLTFNLKLLFQIHAYFLGTLYSWAGKVRTVEISKGSALFCASAYIEKELVKLGKVFKQYVPVVGDSKVEVSKKLAFLHCELNALHPFREGNGRTLRLFLDLLAVQSGLSIIRYGASSKKAYIEACKAGMQQDYSKMQKVIYKGFSK